MSKKPENFEFRKPTKSYAEMRRAGTMGDRPLRASAVTRKKPGDETVADETPASAPAAPPLTVVRANEEEVDTASENSVGADDLTVPGGTEGPEQAVEGPAEDAATIKRAVRNASPEATSQEVVKDTKKTPIRSTKSTVQSEQKLPDRMVRLENGSVQMHGYVYCPLPGRFTAFDKLATAYGPRKAMGVAIDFGLDILHEHVTAGEPVEPVLDYSTEKKRSLLRRSVHPDVVEWATNTLDPANVLTHHAFAGQLWKTALGLYLAKG